MAWRCKPAPWPIRTWQTAVWWRCFPTGRRRTSRSTRSTLLASTCRRPCVRWWTSWYSVLRRQAGRQLRRRKKQLTFRKGEPARSELQQSSSLRSRLGCETALEIPIATECTLQGLNPEGEQVGEHAQTTPRKPRFHAASIGLFEPLRGQISASEYSDKPQNPPSHRDAGFFIVAGRVRMGHKVPVHTLVQGIKQRLRLWLPDRAALIARQRLDLNSASFETQSKKVAAFTLLGAATCHPTSTASISFPTAPMCVYRNGFKTSSNRQRCVMSVRTTYAPQVVEVQHLGSHTPSPSHFFVDELLPANVVTLLAAHGGTGKPGEAQLPSVQCSGGSDWIRQEKLPMS